MMLTHEQGVLSALLSKISSAGGSVLTITQSLPIHGKASVTLSLDKRDARQHGGADRSLGSTPGAEQVRLLAVGDAMNKKPRRVFAEGKNKSDTFSPAACASVKIPLK